jgi:hypothetical protein
MLDMLTTICPQAEGNPQTTNKMIDVYIDLASELIADVAHSSRYRQQNGKEFWGGYLRHRMERFKGRDSGQSMSVPPAWRTEWLDPPLNVDGAWKRNPRVYLRAPGPYGATVLAIEPQFDIGAA